MPSGNPAPDPGERQGKGKLKNDVKSYVFEASCRTVEKHLKRKFLGNF
jgi:hypothetical protein